MTDSWEDWDNDNYEVPSLNIQQREEQLKRLEERKLIEESDNALAKHLFEEDTVVGEELKLLNTTTHFGNKDMSLKKNLGKKVSKQKENEEKQKAISKKIKEDKAKKIKEKALFGDSEYDDEYAEYEDKFY